MGSPLLLDDKVRALLSANIRALITELDISQNELARRSDVSQKQVNNIVEQRTGCGIDALSAIAKVAGVEAWMLLLPEFESLAHNRMRFMRSVRACARLPEEKLKAIDVMLGV